MSGNVWEWTSNRYGRDERRVRRSGSWLNVPASVRSDIRAGTDPDTRGFDIGFRLAQDIE
jgi:formylglycine-generating enzyme required for sulfatase activity